MRSLYFKLLNLLPSWLRSTIPVDKLAHFFAGAIIAAPFWLFAAQPLHGLIAATLAGFGKELVDHFNNRKAEENGKPAPNSVELLDAVATAAGGLLVFILSNHF